jgi:hypothetical protein
MYGAEGVEEIGLPYAICSYKHVQGGIQPVPGESVKGEEVLDVDSIYTHSPLSFALSAEET